MKRSLLPVVLLLAAQIAASQNSVKITIRNADSKQPVAGAAVSVRGTGISSTTDVNGKVELVDISNGDHVIEVSSPGYENKELRLIFPLAEQTDREILIRVNNQMGEV